RGARGGVPPPLAVAGPARVKAPASGAGAFGQVNGSTIRDWSPTPSVVGPVPIAFHTSTRTPPPVRIPSAPELECRPAAWVKCSHPGTGSVAKYRYVSTRSYVPSPVRSYEMRTWVPFATVLVSRNRWNAMAVPV